MTALKGLLPELEVVRKDFPILERTLAGGLPLVYLDSANTSQKPQVVIDTMVDHLERTTPTSPGPCTTGRGVDRGVESARDKVAAFLNAPYRVVTRWSSARTPPRRSTWSPTPHAWSGRSRWFPATRSSSPRSSTTPTSSMCPSSPPPPQPSPLAAGHVPFHSSLWPPLRLSFLL